MLKVADQLADAAGSVGSNHRAMRRARSRREFAAKLQTVVEEVDEAVYWLEISTTTCPNIEGDIRLLDEARALRAIFVKARATNRCRSLG
jgi:four helix bundle protein